MKININTDFNKVVFMTILKVGVLKKLLENIPDDYDVDIETEKTTSPLNDKVTIDVSGNRIILQK